MPFLNVFIFELKAKKKSCVQKFTIGKKLFVFVVSYFFAIFAPLLLGAYA